MRVRVLSFLSLLCTQTPLTAQEQKEDYDPDVLLGCLDAGWFRDGSPSDCIGVAAAHCMQSEISGSTVGVAYCFDREWEQWDGLLNQTYQAVLAEQEAMDAETAAYNPNLPSGVEALRKMQRAWIAYRDDACAFDRAQWGGGTGGGPSTLQCYMELTAQQTLFLRGRLQ